MLYICDLKNMLKLGITCLFKQIMGKSGLRYFSKSQIDDFSRPVSIPSIKKLLNLERKSLEDGYTCLITPCPMCSHDSNKKLKNLYINKTTGFFMCSSCKQHGEWGSLEGYYSSKKEKGRIESLEIVNCQEELKQSLDEIENNTVLIGDSKSFQLEKIINLFKLPIISCETLRNLKVRIDKTQENIYFPLENVEAEIVGYRKINVEKFDDVTIPTLKYGGLLIGKSKTKNTAVLVPTISNFLTLYESRISQNLVCLPNGVDNLSQYILPCLERYEKIILWLENDLKSWEAVRHFAKKLDEKRCFFVRPSEENLLTTTINKKEISSILNSSQQIWHEHITNFANLRADVLSGLQNIDKVDGVKWKRFPTLNKILKGHRRGELTVITGPTGSGKTTFMSEYSLDLACQGVNTLWGSFEIKNCKLATTMLHQFSEISLGENLSLFDTYADKFERLPIHFMTFFGQQSIKAVMEAVEHASYVYDLAHVIIDNVQFMMGVEEEYKYMDRFWKQDVLIAAFRNFATRKNCHVTLVIHPRKERIDEDLTLSSIFGGAKATQEADNVLIIQDKRVSTGKRDKCLQICKNRYNGELGIMPLEFDKSSLSLVSKKENKEKTPRKPSKRKSKDEKLEQL